MNEVALKLLVLAFILGIIDAKSLISKPVLYGHVLASSIRNKLLCQLCEKYDILVNNTNTICLAAVIMSSQMSSRVSSHHGNVYFKILFFAALGCKRLDTRLDIWLDIITAARPIVLVLLTRISYFSHN